MPCHAYGRFVGGENIQSFSDNYFPWSRGDIEEVIKLKLREARRKREKSKKTT